MASPATTRASSTEHDREEKASPVSSRPTLHGEKQAAGDDKTFVDETGSVVLEESRGVAQMAALHSRLSVKYRILLYGGFAILA